MQHNNHETSEGKDALYIAGGLALMVLGAGLIISHPAVKQAVSAGIAGVLPELQGKFGPDLSAIRPDIQRYLRLKNM